MLHPKNEAALLAYVASALGQILTLLNHAGDTISASVRTQVAKIVQQLPVEAGLAAAAFSPLIDPPAKENLWTDLQRLQLRNFQEMRERFRSQYGDEFVSQVFDGKDAPPDATSAELGAELSATKAENAKLTAMLQQLSDRMALLEKARVEPSTPATPATPAAPAAPAAPSTPATPATPAAPANRPA